MKFIPHCVSYLADFSIDTQIKQWKKVRKQIYTLFTNHNERKINWAIDKFSNIDTCKYVLMCAMRPMSRAWDDKWTTRLPTCQLLLLDYVHSWTRWISAIGFLFAVAVSRACMQDSYVSMKGHVETSFESFGKICIQSKNIQKNWRKKKIEKKILSTLLIRIHLQLNFFAQANSISVLHLDGLNLFHIDFIVAMPYCIRIHLCTTQANNSICDIIIILWWGRQKKRSEFGAPASGVEREISVFNAELLCVKFASLFLGVCFVGNSFSLAFGWRAHCLNCIIWCMCACM